MEQYIISTGRDSAMYTLRAYFEQVIGSSNGESWTHKGYQYIQNLSTDKNKAIEKAKQLTGCNDIAFKAPEDLNEFREGLAEEKRLKQEQIRYAEEQRLADQKLLVDLGIYPFTGQKFEDWNVKIINYWLEMEECEGITKYIQEYIIKHFDQLRLPKPTKSEPWGNEKERKSFSGIVTAVIIYEGYDYRGRPCTKSITKIVTNDGYLLTCFGNCSGDIGEKIKGKATIKSYGEYKGDYQTVIQRVKLS